MLGPNEWEVQMAGLALKHKKVSWRKSYYIIGKYNQATYKKLNQIRFQIAEASSDIITLIPSARWLFDNFQMMYREIKKVKTTETSYGKLPILRASEDKGYPRIFTVAGKMVELSGGYLNEESITLMMKAYQKNLPLMDKELWALPEMLGLCLLLRIIEVSEDIIRIIKIKSEADRFFKDKIGLQKDYLDITPLLHKIPKNCMENTSFHCHVIYLLRNMSIDNESIQRYFDFHCKSGDMSYNPSDIYKIEGKMESSLESSIRTLIISLREINQIDEEVLFENLSPLESILSEDPDQVYPRMETESKGLYRSIIEKLSYRYRIPEIDIAKECIKLATTGRDDLNCPRHVGAYLVGKGYPLLKSSILKKPIPDHIQEKKNIKGSIYFISVALIACLAYVLLIYIFPRYSIGSTRDNVLLLAVAIPMLIGISLDITKNILTRIISVQRMPSMDYLKEIPDGARTFVVMPVIISTKEQGLEYLDRLLKYYLANRQPNLYFALLADYTDASKECLPEDDVIKDALVSRVNELNGQYPSAHQPFSLFIRCRKWNESENCFMGWERKRGKLEEFNTLLHENGTENTSYTTILCDTEILKTFQYVITLDADSNLIRDNASKLIGLIDHPINRAVLDPESRKVKEGYAIIQPSVRNHIIDKNGSLFPKIYGGQTGIETYSCAISDIYQDVFKEGSFIGKGIYNIKAFHQILHKTIPENTVLSHDLLESCYVRTAFASAANIMDSFPNSVLSYAKREHRWIRGDWQLLPWLFKKKTISGVSKWKILDNLRRSFLPASKTLFILMNLALIPDVYYLWIPLVFFPDLLCLLSLMFHVVLKKIERPRLAFMYKNFFKDVWGIIQKSLVEIILTPYMAYMAMDAVIRTLYRLFISKKSLLMWKSHEVVEKSLINTKKGYFLHMWSTFIPAAIIIVLLLTKDIPVPGVFLYAALALTWAFSFLIACDISQPGKAVSRTEGTDHEEVLTDAARRSWKFFKDFSSMESNWLCPDNYQITKKEKITDKTSPTNIGLQLLSVLSARDFGFETLSFMLEDTEKILNTVSILPKWKGHLYNWYHIRTLEVLHPQYISTVDSGNFIGDLVAMKHGLQDQKVTPILPACLLSELDHKLNQVDFGVERKKEFSTVGDYVTEITWLRDVLINRNKKPCENSCGIDELTESINQMEKEVHAFGLYSCNLQSCITLSQAAKSGNEYAGRIIEKIDALCGYIDKVVEDVDFTALYDKKRRMFRIGYHVSTQTLDEGCYDLIESESSLTSFLAIAKGNVPVKHWYKLGRPMTLVKGIPSFVSWNGTMFEYLMPHLLLREYDDSVFAESSKAAVLQQMRYGKNKGIPWGISESQYFRFDLQSNYQYRAFGIPGLRLQPTLSNSLVVAPYATMLALDYAGEEAVINLKRMTMLGAYGKYGFYEAIDFNGPDPVNMTPYCIVKSFMAHHQGMSLIAMNNYLHDQIMQRRFHAEPMVKATEILLEEKRKAYFVSISKKGYTINIDKMDPPADDILSRRYISKPAPPIPVAGYLSNGSYSLMITSDGDGFSNYKGIMIYRWRADVHANTGQYIYIKDMKENKFWSAAYHPTYTEPDEYQVIFSPNKVEYKRRDGIISTHTSISLSLNHDLEIRKITFTNHGNHEKQLEVTSYLEIVGDKFIAELSHPAFNKLFLEIEFIEEHSMYLAKRRSNQDESQLYLMHMVKTGNKPAKNIEFENDRAKFIGRNHTVKNPDALINSITLSNKAEYSNDPVMSLRVNILLGAEETACVSFITGVCASKEEAIKISDELSVPYRIDDIFEKFRLQTEMEMRYLNITGQQMNAFQNLISPIYYPSAFYRGPFENIRRNWKNQSFLWRFGISGDNPIMLLKASSMEEAGIIKDVLTAYEYLRMNRVNIDLIILNEAKHSYMQELTNLLFDMISSLRIHDEDKNKPSLFILQSYQMIPAEVDLLITVASVVFSKKTGIYFRNIRDKLKETMVV